MGVVVHAGGDGEGRAVIDLRLYGHRTLPHFTATVLDRSERELWSLGKVLEGSVNLNRNAQLGGSASLVLGDERIRDIDFDSNRLRMTYHPGVRGVEPWNLGTFLFASPQRKNSATGVSWSLGLQTKMIMVDVPVQARFDLPVGANLVASAVELVQSTGATRIAVTPSDAVTREAMVFEAGTRILEIVNKLLKAAGYWSLWVDREGQFRFEPYVRPQDQAVTFELVAGPQSIHYPEWESDQETASIPNLVVLTTGGDDESIPLVGVAKNMDPESKYSIPYRGYAVPWDGGDGTVEASSQAVIDEMAKRILEEAMDPVLKISLTSAILPVDCYEVGRFADGPFDDRFSLQEINIPNLRYDAHMDITLRKVVDLAAA